MKTLTLKYRIMQFSEKGRLNSRDARLATQRMAAVMDMCQHLGNDADDNLLIACDYAIASYKYAFKDAMKIYKCDDPIEFYENQWQRKISLSAGSLEINLGLQDLMQASCSTEFLDESFDFTVSDIISGKITEENLQDLIGVLDKLEIQYDNFTSNPEEVTNIYANIPEASEFRRILCEKDDNERTDKILSSLYKKLDVAVFTGVSSCTLDFEKFNEKQLKKLKSRLEDLEFSMSWSFNSEDAGTLFIKAIARNGDYSTQYTEESLQRLLHMKQGGAYYFVATYCDKVLIPKLLSERVSELVSRLESVTINDASITIKKIITKTDVYQKLFEQLKLKNFSIEDDDLTYTVRW